MMLKAPLDSSPRLASGGGDYVSNDTASDGRLAVCDEPFDTMLPSGQAIVQSLEEPRNTSTAGK